jgi:hypothetical protein
MVVLRFPEFLIEVLVLADGTSDARNDDDRYEC